jgi:hypothetical protein
VTANRLLAAASRRYVIGERQLAPVQCPPILYITQVATIAWLLKDQTLSSDIAARELLINCYAAARPDAEWFRHFREGIEGVVGDLEHFGRDPQNSLILQAARRIAQEESLSNSALMQELNAAEIIDRSREYAANEQRRISDQHHAEQKTLIEQHEKERAEETERHKEQIKDAEERASARIRSQLCDTNAKRIVRADPVLIVCRVCIGIFFGFDGRNEELAGKPSSEGNPWVDRRYSFSRLDRCESNLSALLIDFEIGLPGKRNVD